ncbi:helix-turn-helix domain-containing protein [Aquimarina longa]|uniref:helix-turn-helix domain-containing protein n=1 Tax=Aquimarina longa TaxID=1080221 RepID=UPI0007867D67|nr:AraC family transcriptional regulator [Aquimarina longa]
MILTFFIITIFQGVVFGLIVLNSPLFKSDANKYLTYAILSLSFSLLNYVFDEYTELYKTIPLLRFIDLIDSSIIFPVFIFLFVVHKVNHPIKHSKKILWLLIPYFCSLINSIFTEIDNLYEVPLFIEVSIVILELIEFLILVLFIPGILIYTYTFIKFSNTTQEKRWITHLWVLTFTLFISWVLTLLSGMIFEYEFTPIAVILPLFAVLLIHWTAYVGIYKYRLARDQEEIKALLNKRNPDHKNLVLTEVNSLVESFTKENSYFKKLENLCIDHQIYKDNTLTRDKVAEKLGISPGYVSQLINTITGDNFSTYINKYRVEAVKDIILDSEFDNYSLLAIGLECGFPSKSTFYNAFKKITDTTPNAYRKKHKQENPSIS